MVFVAGVSGNGRPAFGLLVSLVYWLCWRDTWFVAITPIGWYVAYVAYCALRMLVNTSVLTVRGDTLRVRHRPLPALGQRTVRLDALRQLFCEQRKTKGGWEVDLKRPLEGTAAGSRLLSRSVPLEKTRASSSAAWRNASVSSMPRSGLSSKSPALASSSGRGRDFSCAALLDPRRPPSFSLSTR